MALRKVAWGWANLSLRIYKQPMLALSNIFTGSCLGGPQQREVSDVFYVCGLAAVLVVACAARFYGISELPLWMDEAYTYFVATRPLHDIVFNELDNHPPLFYALQHFWLLSFPNITAFRFPAAAIGSITAIVVALATSDLVNRQAGLAAGALLAISTGHIHFSQDARMYTLLTLGLSLATWGLLGLLQSDKRQSFYWIAYVIGGAVAVYSQIVALIYLAILNAIAFIWAHGGKRHFLSANLVLLIVGLPWLLSIPDAVEAFQGLPREPVALAQWHVRNFIGFPGIALPFKIAAEILVLSIYVVGAVLAWRSGRRAFAMVIIGILIFYPLTLGGLEIVTPIISNRIFIPCIIPASMLFGAAVGLPERRTLQFVVASSVLFLACWSEFEAYRLRGKIEDMPQALAVAAARGSRRRSHLIVPNDGGYSALLRPRPPGILCRWKRSTDTIR